MVNPYEPQYRVVVNDEDQYAIWPLNRDAPSGWRDAGASGPKEECLAYVRQVWHDLRPRRLRAKSDA